MGFVIMPPWAQAALVQAKRLSDAFSPAHVQETLAAFMTEGHFSRHVRKMHRVYAQRRQVLLDALAHHCGGAWVPTASIAGLHLGVHYQGRRSVHTVLAQGTARGLGLESFSGYAVKDTVAKGFAIGYGALGAQHIEQGVSLLGKMLSTRN
jgi:GntR family transcriptional regulator/MocR family aminotransferase